MAGLAAAAQAAELGAHALVLEKGPVPGGSMRLSSGVVWRFRDRDTFRAECPGGDQSLQALIVDRLDDDLAWLEALGAPVRERCTANPLTEGRRFDVDGLTEALVRRVPELRVGKPLKSLPPGTPVVLATGGFQGDRELVRRFVTPEADRLWLRANPWSSGDGLRLALDAGAATTAAMDEFYGRNLPAPPAIVEDEDFVRLSQLYARHARIQAVGGYAYPAERIAWHESDVAQWLARQPGARAWYIVHPSRFDSPAGAGRTVRESIEAAKAAGGPVEEGETGAAVLVAPGITSTLGGIQVNREARVIGRDGKPVPGLFVAGGDAGGISLGGYSSGLAAALVLGRAAARSALGACPA
jgi:succinate dehydrogenase/fumarate reductase flavoprotein subunit